MIENLENVIAGLSYKPGWSFSMIQVPDTRRNWRPVFIITATVRHAVTLEEVTFNIRRIVPRVALGSVGDFLHWWEDILAEAEFHELREFARYHGKLIDDPHEVNPAPAGHASPE
jgi:hypothetical protein